VRWLPWNRRAGWFWWQWWLQLSLAAERMLDGHLAIRTMTLPDRFIDHASPERCMPMQA